MGTKQGSPPARTTFTQLARREQLVRCAIEAIAETGYQRASVGEVARRAGVSKGVVSYHFAARDDLIRAVIDYVFASADEFMRPRLDGTAPAGFVRAYIESWADYYRTHRAYMLAVAEIATSFRDESGRRYLGVATIAPELDVVQRVLTRGQADGLLRPFSTRVMAVSLKSALDGLLDQLSTDPTLDIDAYAAELVALFERATSLTGDTTTKEQ